MEESEDDAAFVEEIEGQGEQEHGAGVRGRGKEEGEGKAGHERVGTGAPHEIVVQNA